MTYVEPKTCFKSDTKFSHSILDSSISSSGQKSVINKETSLVISWTSILNSKNLSS